MKLSLSDQWGRQRLKQEIPNDAALIAYLKPQWRWIGEPGKQVHIILEVTDNGTPALIGYQRVICNIKRN